MEDVGFTLNNLAADPSPHLREHLRELCAALCAKSQGGHCKMGFLHLGTTVRWGEKTQVPDSSEVRDGCTQVQMNSQPPYSSPIFASPAIRWDLSYNRDLVNACPSNRKMRVRPH